MLWKEQLAGLIMGETFSFWNHTVFLWGRVGGNRREAKQIEGKHSKGLFLF